MPDNFLVKGSLALQQLVNSEGQRQWNGGGGGGGALGASAPPTLFAPGAKMPFFGNESALFSWNRSAVLAKLKCPFWSVPSHFRGASAASAEGYFSSYSWAPGLPGF